jgi:hypothetical protein
MFPQAGSDEQPSHAFNGNWGEMRLGLPHYLLKEALAIFVGGLLRIAATGTST